MDAAHFDGHLHLRGPKAPLRPWVVMKTYKRAPKVEIMEYACQENNWNPILAPTGPPA